MCPRRFIVLFAACLAASASAQEAPRAKTDSPLAIRQQRIEQMTAELEQKFKQLTLALQSAEPRQAERLQNALNRAKELQIQSRMSGVREALDRSEFDTAAGQQQALLADLQLLLTLLLTDTTNQQAVSDESERLKELTKTIERLLDTERQLQRHSEALAMAPNATPDQAESLARQQDELTEKTSAVADGMGELGAEDVNAAKGSMQTASASLRKQQAAAAGQAQKDAIQSLLNALDDIKERQKELDTARERDQMAQLASHFRAMLAEQEQITLQTAALDAKRSQASGQLSRLERNAVRVLGDRERRLEPLSTAADPREPGLAGKAQQALDLLTQSGASLAIPQVVTQLRDDLIAVGNRLVDHLQTGPEIGLLQADIEMTLETLADVLGSGKKAQPPGDSSAAASGAGGNQKSKLPASAELQLLRAAQLQINRRTATLAQARTMTGMSDDAYSAAAKEVAARQALLAEMTARILEAQR
jgi:hypothetical protein